MWMHLGIIPIVKHFHNGKNTRPNDIKKYYYYFQLCLSGYLSVKIQKKPFQIKTKKIHMMVIIAFSGLNLQRV